MSDFQCPIGDPDCPLKTSGAEAVHVTDLVDGKVAQVKSYCRKCAEKFGLVQPKSPLKISPEILEDLLASGAPGMVASVGSVAGDPGAAGRSRTATPAGAHCPGCSMTLAEFKARGRLGCPRCYDAFRDVLLPVLERVHDSIQHVGSYPTTEERDTHRADTLARLQRDLRTAITDEDYEAAARLRDEIQKVETGER